MSLIGRSIIAGFHGAGSGESVRAVDPASGLELDPEFAFVTEAAVDAAAAGARAAFDVFRETSPAERAAFLEAIADNLEARREEIVARACLESGQRRQPPVAAPPGERRAPALILFNKFYIFLSCVMFCCLLGCGRGRPIGKGASAHM